MYEKYKMDTSDWSSMVHHPAVTTIARTGAVVW